MDIEEKIVFVDGICWPEHFSAEESTLYRALQKKKKFHSGSRGRLSTETDVAHNQILIALPSRRWVILKGTLLVVIERAWPLYSWEAIIFYVPVTARSSMILPGLKVLLVSLFLQTKKADLPGWVDCRRQSGRGQPDNCKIYDLHLLSTWASGPAEKALFWLVCNFLGISTKESRNIWKLSTLLVSRKGQQTNATRIVTFLLSPPSDWFVLSVALQFPSFARYRIIGVPLKKKIIGRRFLFLFLFLFLSLYL